MLCDGLGHGPLARVASQAAIAAFHAAPVAGCAAVVHYLHATVSHTRGVVAMVVEFDLARTKLRFAGIGNIAGAVIGDGRRQTLMTQPGIVGQQRPRLREVETALPRSAVVVLHSDGLTGRWTLERYPGLIGRSPVLIAATLLRDAGVRRDDAAVLVAQVQP
jgi:hypothetical protein